MAMKDKCKQVVAQALGKQTLNAQEVANIEQRINDAMKNLAKQDIQNWRNMSPNDRLVEAAKQVAIDIKTEIKRKNKIAALNITALNRELNIILNHPTLSAMESIDRSIAFHGDMSGIQSVSKQARSIANLYKGEIHELYQEGDIALGLVTNKDFARDFIKERFGEDSGNASAKRISDAFGNATTGMKDRFNRSGGDIRELTGWGIWTSWSPAKVLEKGLDRWLELALRNIDRNTMVHGDGRAYNQQELEEFLTAAYKTIKSDGANKVEVGKPNFTGNSSIANRHSDSRKLHWKNADAWLEMQNEFGDMPLTDIINSNIDRMSKEIALIERFGSNPKGTLKILQDAAAKHDSDIGKIPVKQTRKTRSRIDDMFDEFTGSQTGSEFWANIGLAYRSVNVSSMLGGTLLTSVTDHAMIKKTAHVHGLAYHKIFGEITHQLNPMNKADRDHAYYMGLGVDELSSSVSRWADDGLTSVHGQAANFARASTDIASAVLRASALTEMTRASKTGFDLIMMAKYADLTKSKAWDDLDIVDRTLFEKTGLSKDTWEIMRIAEPNVTPKGTKVMSARSIYAIPDDKILALKGIDSTKMTKNEAWEVAERFRDKAATQLQTHILDEQGMAVLEADLRERTKFVGGTKRGTLAGEVLRNATQFKSFPLAFLMRHGSRAYSQGGWRSKAAYAVPLLFMTTMLGGLSLQLKEISKGNDPLIIWDDDDPKKSVDFFKRSFVAGGGLPILGDIIVAGMDPTGRDAESFLTGPFGSDFKTFLNLTAGNISQAANGVETNFGNEVFKFAKSKTPGQNLWYTQAATNKMLFDQAQDALAPGYRGRVMRKAERDHGRRSWLGDFDWGDMSFDDARAPDFERVVK